MPEKFILRKKEEREKREDAVIDAAEPADERKLHLVENNPITEFDPEKTNAQKGLSVTEEDGKAVVEVEDDLYDKGIYKDTARKKRLSFSQGSVDDRVTRRRKR